MQTSVRNQLSSIRRSRGLGAAELARKVGVSRQTIYAIEAGTYVPNTEVSLKLARELEVVVDELFSLAPAKHEAAAPFHSEVLGAANQGQPVRVCTVGKHLVCVPVNPSPYFLPEADGVIAKTGRSDRRADVIVFPKDDSFTKRLMVAGCDPAIGLLARMVERLSGVEVVSAAGSSRLALNWLKAGKVHIAGTHLKDGRTGEFNVPIVRRELPGEDITIVTFARWEEGFVTAPGNPKGIKNIADLTLRRVTIINREAGSGSRALLDAVLHQGGIPSTRIAGYDRIAHGHLAASHAVCAGEVDCCIATRSAARAFGLHFVPLQSERYDFVLRRSSLALPVVQSFLDVLQRASLRRRLELLAGYDTAETGVVVA
jgi:molybdate-binding protein/DNA-binding XRE family transcriptional regulator